MEILFTFRNIRCRRQIVEIIFIVGNAASHKLKWPNCVGGNGWVTVFMAHLPLESFNDTLNALFYEQL